jgi:hypothetical protein
MDEDQGAPEEYVDNVSAVQNVLASLDPTALCTGFVAVVEWIEEDGSPTLSMIHSPMQPWHLNGVLDHARKYHELPIMLMDQGDVEFEGEWEEED